MVNSEPEESLNDIYPFENSHRCQNDESEPSLSIISSSTVDENLKDADGDMDTEINDIVPSLIDFVGQSQLMAEIRDNKPNFKLPSYWDDDNDCDIIVKDMSDPNEQVLTAAENGDIELLKSLINDCPSLLLARDADGYTALHRAAYNGHLEVVNYLLSIGADPEWKTNNGWTVLHCAATWSMYEVVALILRHNVDVNSRSNGNLTPLHLAVSSNQPEDRVLTTVRYLLEAPGIDAAIISNSGDSPLQLARRMSGKVTEMLTLYFSKP